MSNKPVSKQTLCFSCQRPGTSTCAWDASRANTPVEGWTAEKTYHSLKGRVSESYRVIDCPLYVKDEPRIDYSQIDFKIKWLVRKGLNNKQIADKLEMSYEAVRSRVRRLRKEGSL